MTGRYRDFFAETTDILSATTCIELFKELDQHAKDAGFAAVSYAALRPPLQGQPGAILFDSSSPTNFIETYKQEDFITCDPVVARAVRSPLPFSWMDCPEFTGFDKPRRGRRPRALTVLDHASDFGYQEGHVVPCSTIVDGLTVPGFVTFFWPEGRTIRPVLESPLWFRYLVQLFHEKYISLSGISFRTVATVPLTDRERQCLVWLAMGKNASDLATLMNISERTAEHYCQSVVTKLNAANRVQAVAKAILMGVIYL